MSKSPTYHDLHITTASIPRTSIFNLPHGLEVACNRAGGWSLWSTIRGHVRLATEYPTSRDQGMTLDVGGHVIVDSLTGAPD